MSKVTWTELGIECPKCGTGVEVLPDFAPHHTLHYASGYCGQCDKELQCLISIELENVTLLEE